ncbi:MAG: DUF1284 domain-containing protein [Oscillospiraceae bacterium]|nr:DUF1284 domain-containing protein [Ruminococcus sp.]MDE6707069.1 DUF1284 domain-containing protein [Oscillospiraceae bacterium]
MLKFNLRPHHGLCIAFFEGRGYDDNFTQHMKKMISILQEQNPKIQLVSESDIICSHCPHQKNKLCDSDCKVQRYDKAVLKVCNLQENQVLHWSEFCEIIYKKILSSKPIYEICVNCQWLAICQKKKIENYKFFK